MKQTNEHEQFLKESGFSEVNTGLYFHRNLNFYLAVDKGDSLEILVKKILDAGKDKIRTELKQLIKL